MVGRRWADRKFVTPSEQKIINLTKDLLKIISNKILGPINCGFIFTMSLLHV